MDSAHIRKRQGETLRRVRTSQNVTINDLAAAVNVNPSAISHWETGRYTPRLDKQVAVAEALDVPWLAIFGVGTEAA